MISFWILPALLALGACGKKEEKVPSPIVQLMREDAAQLATTEPQGAKSFDGLRDGAFTKVFGGTSGAHVKAFFDERVHYFTDPATLDEQLDGHSFPFQGWMKEVSQEKAKREGETKVGATNYGTLLWLLGVINDVPLRVTIDEQDIAIDSSRAGIIVGGEGYETTGKTREGRSYPIPVTYRQSILLHEARHSDCSGGLTRADLAQARSAKTSEDYPNRACGHLHVTCPSTSDYAGIAACDKEPWGAYTVGAIFAEATTANYADGSIPWQVMRLWAIDQRSRSLVSDAMSGTPDLSSRGLVP